MTILTANLKHLYQCRGAWFWHLIILCQMPAFFLSRDSNLGYLLVSLFSGILVASLQKEILSKPFSFCLPRHEQIPRRLFLRVGVVINGLLACMYIFHSAVGFPSVIFVVIAGGVVGMLVYLFSVSVTFSDLQSDKILTGVLVISLFIIIAKRWDRIIQKMIVSDPLVVICLGLLLCVLVWRRLGSKSLRREYCGKVVSGIFDGFNKKKLEKLKQAKLAEKLKNKPDLLKTSSAVERYFLSRIRQAEPGGLQQHIWGCLYKTFGILLSKRRQEWMKNIMLVMGMLCFLCYMPRRIHNILFFAAGIIVINMNLWVHSSLSVSGGRRERFWSALTLAVAAGILLTVLPVILAMSTHLLEIVMPQVTIKGEEYTFHSIGLKLSFMPLLVVPFVLALGLIFHKKPMLKMMFLMGTVYLLMFLRFAIKKNALNQFVEIWPMLVVVLLLCIWGGFIWVLRHISMRCCLVNQGR
ncbi:MAG: hypothetical protein FVQ79_01275 [Planctomycetes bacterium]|nr:hypothetical protein [Planctomycetota bacterium]